MKKIWANGEVMNNKDLRREIWKFFKKDNRKKCIICKNLFYRDEILNYPIWDGSLWIDQCKKCSWTANTRDILG